MRDLKAALQRAKRRETGLKARTEALGHDVRRRRTRMLDELSGLMTDAAMDQFRPDTEA